ncbi:MAG: AAA family ATPase, partial [Alphaproteobacteria bacterium]
MRFRSFEFQHYAGFENRLLEFDPDKRLHIILGANEAGKSRLLRAFVRFLYGFPSRNDPDQFGTIRSKSKLLASVQIDGKFENFERNTTKTNGFSAAGSEVSVETLQAALGGVNEKQFLNLHALSHDELRDGGQELMSGQGNLGQSLFAAGAGLVPIQKKIAYHEAQAADLFRPRGTTKKINELIAKRVALQEQLKGVEFNQQKYAELSGKIHKAERARDNLAQLLAEKRAVLLTVQKTSELVLKRDFLTSKNTAALEQCELKALKLKDKCNELHLPEDWLMGDHVGFLEVVKQLSADLEDAARQLENSKSSLLEDQNVDEKVQSLDVSELVGLPDLDHLQKNLTSLENQLSEKKNEVLDLTRQLDLPSVDFGDVPASDEMRGLIEQARGTIQEERTLVKRIESVKSSLRDLESQKTRLSQEAPEIDEQQFQETIDQRDDCIRQAIILNAARKFEATAEKLTNVQALLSNLDKLSAKRLSKADDLAKLASLTNEINKAEAEISAIDQDLKGCETTKLNLKATWSEKWLNAGISQIDMRDYSRWQSLYETFLEKRKGVINLELGVSQSEANVVGARTIIASVFEKWSGPMGKKQGGYSTVEQYNMLNSWA